MQLLALVAVTACAFAYTVHIRQPWFGVLSEARVLPSAAWHQWSTASTTAFLQRWHEETPAALTYGYVESPASIEFEGEPKLYTSYPPGTLFLPYLTLTLMDREPSHAFVMAFNLANHLALALILGLIALVLLRAAGERGWPGLVLSLIPPLVYLLEPSLLFWHQQVYFADQAVLLPFALLILCEVVRDFGRPGWAPRVAGAAQAALLFYGTLTDWLFVCVAAALWAKRGWQARSLGFRPLMRTTLFVAAPVGLALALFAAQVYALGTWDLLYDRFLCRTSLDEAACVQHEQTGVTLAQFFRTFFGRDLGAGRLPLAALLLLLLVPSVRGTRGDDPARPTWAARVLRLAWFVLGACLLQVFLLRNHSAAHLFATQKFWIPLSLFAFSLLPYACVQQLRTVRGVRLDREARTSLATVVCVGATMVFLVAYHPTYEDLFTPPDQDLPVAARVFARFAYDDVVFTPDYYIQTSPPQRMSYTMKLAYVADTPPEVRYWLDQRPGLSPNVVVVFREEVPPEWRPVVAARRVEREGPFRWVRVPHAEVEAVFGPAGTYPCAEEEPAGGRRYASSSRCSVSPPLTAGG